MNESLADVDVNAICDEIESVTVAVWNLAAQHQEQLLVAAWNRLVAFMNENKDSILGNASVWLDSKLFNLERAVFTITAAIRELSE